LNLTDYTYLLNHPEAINTRRTEELDNIVTEFPYFQGARALRLKGLYNENSFRYNYALKVTAAYTADRSVLFDFITSDNFTALHRELYQQKLEALHNIEVRESEDVSQYLAEQSVLASIRESGADRVTETETDNSPVLHEEISAAENEVGLNIPVKLPEAVLASAENLNLGRPLEFSPGEKHSFQEWLQLSQLKPIEREPENTVAAVPAAETQPFDNVQRQKKNDLIDRFIETNPKIPTLRTEPAPASIIFEPSRAADSSYLMTETLARVYLEQKKYDKAIQAYEILILKYPEKSSFFADRILDIRNLKQNNT
jgi:tetratricopeptide (TPR) repeat protein